MSLLGPDRVMVGREVMPRSEAKCIQCHEPFKFGVNVFTVDGQKEVAISGLCEKCFDALFEDDDESEDEREPSCTSKDGKHSWRRDKDWMGDPSIPNGTCEWFVYRCIECGFEHPGTPADYYEPEPPDRDYGRDRDPGEHDDEPAF
jgi:hypothetical protein